MRYEATHKRDFRDAFLSAKPRQAETVAYFVTQSNCSPRMLLFRRKCQLSIALLLDKNCYLSTIRKNVKGFSSPNCEFREESSFFYDFYCLSEKGNGLNIFNQNF